MNGDQSEELLKCWNCFYIKYSRQYFETGCRGLVFHLKNRDSKEGSGQLFQQYRNCRSGLMYLESCVLNL